MSMPEWGHDPGSRFALTLRCDNPLCDEYGETWTTRAVSQYGATDWARPECPCCGETGEEAR